MVEHQLPKLRVVSSSLIARFLRGHPATLTPRGEHMDGEHMDGKMLFFNEEKDYGFIRTADGERIPVNRAGFVAGHAPVGSCAGMPVQLTLTETAEGRIACGVSRIVEAEHGRARRRSAR